MNRRETIRYIRRIKKSLKKGRHGYFSCYGHRDIVTVFEFSSLEIAARFLRRKGYSVELFIGQIPLGPLCFERPLRVFRYVSISY